jgi:hypothetical protein
VLGLVRAALDPRCAVGEQEWNALTVRAADAGASATLRQQVRRDGDRLIVAVVNGGVGPVDVPLRFEPRRPELPAITVLAEDAQHGVYELASPVPEDEGDAGAVHHVYSARIRLVAGGLAQARFRVDTRVIKRLDAGCRDRDAEACTPTRLPRGHYALYVGQLIVAVDVGPPARIEWDVP